MFHHINITAYGQICSKTPQKYELQCLGCFKVLPRTIELYFFEFDDFSAKPNFSAIDGHKKNLSQIETRVLLCNMEYVVK